MFVKMKKKVFFEGKAMSLKSLKADYLKYLPTCIFINISVVCIITVEFSFYSRTLKIWEFFDHD